jgi:thymidylate kinase
LQDLGLTTSLLSFPGREPGTLGNHVYDLHHDPEKFGVKSLDPGALQLLHVAAHVDAIQTRIRPLLLAGHQVVLDRFWWSTFVYGEVAGVPARMLEGMITAERAAWGAIVPDVLFLVTRAIPLRNEPSELWPRWRDAYAALAKREQELYRVIVVDNSDDICTAEGQIIANL